MKVDIEALETFNRLAQSGAERAAQSFTDLSGVETVVDVTSVDVTTIDDLGRGLVDGDHVGVRVGYEGGIDGSSVLVFSRENAERITDHVMPARMATDGVAESGLKEVGNILLGGFVNGWADRSGEATHLTPPTYVEGRGEALLPEDPSTWSDNGTVFSITSQLRTVGEVIDFDVYLFPQRDSFERLVDEGGSTAASPVPVERLTVLDSMTEHGAKQASDKITTMTGIETEVSVSQLSFVPVEDVASRVPEEQLMAVVLEFEGPPSGYVVIAFDEESAHELADAMVPVDGEFGSVHRSAIEEIGNLMTSGFVDGWANYLERKTEISPPELVTDYGPAVLTSVAARLGHAQEYVFVHDSTISTPNESFHCELYALPNEAELREALESISAEDAAAISDAQLRMTKSYDELQ